MKQTTLNYDLYPLDMYFINSNLSFTIARDIENCDIPANGGLRLLKYNNFEEQQQEALTLAVWVDDEPMVAKMIITGYYSNLIIDTYSNPFEFLNEVDKYHKDTKMILDNYYYAPDGSTYTVNGITLVEKLHAKGFTNLFLLSDEYFNVPEYLHLILKSDKEKIRNLNITQA